MQIVGKVRLARSAWLNHSWHVTLYVTATGLTTSPIVANGRTFEIDFNFIDHRLSIQHKRRPQRGVRSEPMSVATFYERLSKRFETVDISLRIHLLPNEVENPVRFDHDRLHCAYDAEYANRFWRALLQADRVFKFFRSSFIGKASPVHLFWGAPDLAVTRFSGRRAPLHPGGIPHLPDWVTREAYSHEVSSCGFWPGGGAIEYPAFYSYAYPEPSGFREASVLPEAAFYSDELHEFILPYDAVRQATSPDQVLFDFLHTAYEAAANLGKWDRASLERDDAAIPELAKRGT